MSNNLSGYNYPIQNTNPNAVSINIYTPQAYGNGIAGIPTQNNPINSNGYYSLYGANPIPNVGYPQNYNNMFIQQQPNNNGYNMLNQAEPIEKTPQNNTEIIKENSETESKDKDKEQTIVPLTDDYIKTLENYLNDSNPKVRLIAIKDVLNRFKEDDSRKDNPSLIALLNKGLKDSNSAVRFIALITLQLGHSVGNEETVEILKQIQSENKDKLGEDQELASEILLKMAAPQEVTINKGGRS